MFPAAVLIQVLLILLVIGVVLWGVAQIPMDAAIAHLIRVAVIILVAIWLIYLLAGMLGMGPPWPHRP
jgi:hypothetical protein